MADWSVLLQYECTVHVSHSALGFSLAPLPPCSLGLLVTQMSHIWEGQERELAVMAHALQYVHSQCVSEQQVSWPDLNASRVM